MYTLHVYIYSIYIPIYIYIYVYTYIYVNILVYYTTYFLRIAPSSQLANSTLGACIYKYIISVYI